MKLWQTQITSPQSDIVVAVVASILCLLLGADFLYHGHLEVGFTFVFIALANLFNAWRMWKRIQKADHNKDANGHPPATNRTD